MRTKVSIDVIVHEHNLTGYNPYYFFATKWNDGEWGADPNCYHSKEELTKEIAECIVGTHAEYNLDSFFLDRVNNFDKKGIQGYSENSDSLVIIGTLERKELRELAINLGIAIKDRKRILELSDD